MKKLPAHLKKYFWDTDFRSIDSKKNAQYIIERVLEYGDEKALSWLKKNMRRQFIKEVLMHTRALSPRSANFWAFIFGVPRDKILCLKKPFLERRSRHWIW